MSNPMDNNDGFRRIAIKPDDADFLRAISSKTGFKQYSVISRILHGFRAQCRTVGDAIEFLNMWASDSPDELILEDTEANDE